MNEMLYCVSMLDTSESPGAAAELLSAFEYDLSSWTDAETKQIRHTVYFQSAAEAAVAETLLNSLVNEWREYGIEISEIRQSSLKKEDWAESWKIHFKPIEISERLAMKPSWEHWNAKPGQIVLELDPGMSFGTGQHATTKFCLTAIDRFTRESSGSLSMLDAGAGSGILAIAAYKLGCRPVAAFDIDPETIPTARENAQKNGIPDDALPFIAASLTGYQNDMRYDIVAANILSSALVAGREKLLSMVKPGGYLILAGILDTEYPSVRDAFTALGCTEIFSEAEKEWRGGALRAPHAS